MRHLGAAVKGGATCCKICNICRVPDPFGLARRPVVRPDGSSGRIIHAQCSRVWERPIGPDVNVLATYHELLQRPKTA